MERGRVRTGVHLPARIEQERGGPWVEERALLWAYKVLQFCDTLALYFNCTHEAARGESSFLHVPRSRDEDVTVTVARVAPGRYRMRPFPFRRPGVCLGWSARPMRPVPAGTWMPHAIEAAMPEHEVVEVLV